jgi:hypothetical protein
LAHRRRFLQLRTSPVSGVDRPKRDARPARFGGSFRSGKGGRSAGSNSPARSLPRPRAHRSAAAIRRSFPLRRAWPTDYRAEKELERNESPRLTTGVFYQRDTELLDKKTKVLDNRR